MESHDKFVKYDDVNREIQSMLALKDGGPQRQTQVKYDSQSDILTLLESLNRTYSEINAALKTENSQALKDVILKSDIKMSMVCETLLETLKKTTEDKNSLLKENQEIDRARRELENKETTNRILIERLNSELEFKKRNIEELNRVIKDQKDRMSEFKEEFQKARSEVAFFKAKIDELENLRNRANEKLMVYEKEMDALNQLIKEKDECFSALMKEKKEEESKNSNIKARVAELESLVDALNKKAEAKEKNLSLCNSELSKVLCENKKLKVEYEKYKESSAYYEGLYNSLNAQNSYLNEQLNRMLKKSEYSKDIDAFIAKFRKKIKRNKRRVKRLEKENKKLREELEESNSTHGKISPNDTSDSLLKKIDELTARNREYERQLDRLEEEKRDIQQRIRSLDIKSGDSGKHAGDLQGKFKGSLPSNTNLEPSLKARPGNHYHLPSILPTHLTDKRSENGYALGNAWRSRHPVESSYEPGVYKTGNDTKPLFPRSQPTYEPLKPRDSLRDHDRDYFYDSAHRYGTFRSFNASHHEPNPTYTESKTFNEYLRNEKIDEKSNKTYLKLFNLENNYEEKSKEDFVGGFQNDSDVPKSKLELEYDTRHDEASKLFEGSADLPARQKTTQIIPAHPTATTEGGAEAAQNPPLDDQSVDSIKTYRTSSTLKEMMARTDNLQKKFQDLEDQLANINEGESIDKLTDKIKTYNSYYSDWNPESNESDHI